MDKLKPILAQKFWILFVLVLIMPLAGYFMTKGKLAAEITDRWTKLDKAFTDTPAGTGVPNDSWTNRLNDINKQQELHNRRANQELWAKQKELMSWPKDVAPIMAKADYFKELTQEQKGDQVLFKYPLSYRSQIRALWEIVDPLDDGVNLRDSDKRRKVSFPMADLQQSSVMLTENLTPTFSQIWAAQEDIWLQTELLQAIRRLNANSISQGDAFVKQLFKIQLFGGTKATGDATASSNTGMPGGIGGDLPGGMFGPGFGTSRSESTTALSADINLSEEFNAEMEASGGGSGGNSGLGGFGGGAGINMTEMSPGGGGAGGAKTEIKRYLDFVEGQPYKRRGFSIKLIMDHRKVPDLIAELMNSPFPVEIVRVQQVWLSDSGTTSGGAGGRMASSGTGFTGFKPTAGGDPTSTLAPDTGFVESDGPGAATGFNNPSAAGAGGRPGAGGSSSAAAMADPNLAQVAIVGVWTLYLPPPPATDGEQIAPPNSATPPAGLAVTPENVTPATSDAETATADPKPTTTEPTEGNGDESKKADDSDAPKSDPAKPEKTESESDKSAAEKTPPKDDAADEADSNTK